MLWLIIAVVVTVDLSVTEAVARFYDPMRPQGSALISLEAKTNEHELRLEVIVIADNRRSAVINGQNVVEGDQLEGYRVKAITADTVVISSGSNEKRLTLPSADQHKMHMTAVNQ